MKYPEYSLSRLIDLAAFLLERDMHLDVFAFQTPREFRAFKKWEAETVALIEESRDLAEMMREVAHVAWHEGYAKAWKIVDDTREKVRGRA